MNSPIILLADEPTGNLDPQLTIEIAELFKAINARGTTVMMATHNRQVVEQLNGRVLRLDCGHLLSDQGASAAAPAALQRSSAIVSAHSLCCCCEVRVLLICASFAFAHVPLCGADSKRALCELCRTVQVSEVRIASWRCAWRVPCTALERAGVLAATGSCAKASISWYSVSDLRCSRSLLTDFSRATCR